MEKRFLTFLFIIGISFGVIAQQYPLEWSQYTSSGYLFDIQSDRNNQSLTETAFKNNLLNVARANIAKQIYMRVEDFAELEKKSINGDTEIVYSSSTRFSTDLELKLVETKTSYNSETKEGWAIAYIDKNAACQYYQNVIGIFLKELDNTLTIARNYIGAGFKSRAKTELDTILSDFKTTDEAFFFLGIFGFPQTESERLLALRNRKEQEVKQLLADLQYGTSIYLVCTADLFGVRYPTLQNELKGKLSAGGCNFTEDPTQADWVIRIDVSTREYNCLTVNASPLYFAYADANISIDKVVTSQRIYENGISVKGGHTIGYREAGEIACKNLNKELGDLILQNIQQ